METRARDVIGADVVCAWITWRKGCSREGVSNVCISTYELASYLPNREAKYTFTTSQFTPQSAKPSH
jgi:hypothetical protein